MNNAQSRAMRKYLKDLFRFRDWAVHPPADLRYPMLHEDLDSGVDWRFIAFSAKNAGAPYGETREVVAYVLKKVRPKIGELAEWASQMEPRLPGEIDSAPTQSDGGLHQ